MNLEALRDWLTLIRAPGIGPVTAGQLLQTFGTPQALLAAGPRGWRRAGLASELHGGLAQPDLAAIDSDLRWLEGDHRHLILRDDPRYPPLLRDITAAPVALFCQGDTDLLPLPQLAIVGARAASPQGLENARAFAAELARRGLVVSSGLAMGIDGAAHQGALDADGYTIAVFGTGLDRVYPARHRTLAHRIAERGLLVSEFPPDTSGKPEHFPRRNRIISGLAMGVLVVEAAQDSGSLITAKFALEQGREVFAIPGSIHNPLARGCHRLIRQGAKLVETVDDILEEIAPHLQRRSEAAGGAAPAVAVADDDQALLDALGDELRSFDELLATSGLALDALSAALLRLELAGQIAAAAGGRYQRLRRR